MAWPKFLRSLFGGKPDKVPETVEEAPLAAPAAPVEASPDVPDDDEDDVEDDYEDDDDDDDDEVVAVRNPELEAAIVAARSDPAPFLIYADWLQQQGDPRGELIVVQHELESSALDDDQRTELEERARDLLRQHRRSLVGPLDAEGHRFRFGFLRYLITTASALPKGAEKLELAVADPAYVLLESVMTDGDADRLREAFAAIGREGVRVTHEDEYLPDPSEVESVTASVLVKEVGGRRWLEMTSGDGFGMQSGSHSFLVRMRVASGGWSYGCDGSLCEDGLADDPVRSELFVCEASDREVTCELRFGIQNDGGTVTMWFRGSGVLPAGESDVQLRLVACEPLTGLPFDPSPIAERPATMGPQLVTQRNREGTCVPGHGVFEDIGRFVTADGVQRHTSGVSGGYISISNGGADGTLASVYSPRWSKDRDESIKSILLLEIEGRTERFEVPLKDYVAALYPLSNHRVAVAMSGSLAVYDARTGTRSWEQPREATETAREDGWHLSVVEHAGRVYALGNDRVTSYALETGERDGESWSLPALVTTMKHYGIGVPAFHPAPSRVAWMLCGSSGDCGQPPISIIAWRDRDGAGGEVAIAEAGRALEHDAFGRVAVLPDGRIVAVGASVWLVEPPSTTPIRIGAAGDYNGPLQITRHGDRWRLWNPGEGPWYLELE